MGVLREFFLTGQSSIEMPIDDPTVTGLISKRLICINNQLGNSFIMKGSFTSVSINRYVKKHLTDQSINLPRRTTDEIENEKNLSYLKANRPKWIRNNH